jgi:hypothetical protein
MTLQEKIRNLADAANTNVNSERSLTSDLHNFDPMYNFTEIA